MRDFLKKFTGHFFPSTDNSYRPHLLRKPWLLFFLTVVLTAEGLYVAGEMAGQSARTFLSAVLPGEVIALTNNERAKVGDAGVTENSILALAAQNKANDMATKSYFSHVGPDGKEPWAWIREAGYSYRYAGENLAVRFDQSSDVVNAWMASPTHRANIVKSIYTEIGIGVAQGTYEGQPATFIVQYFGTPMAQAAETPVTSTKVEPAPVAAVVPSNSEATAKGGVPPEAVIAGAEVEEVSATPATTETGEEVVAPVSDTQTEAAPTVQSRTEVQTFLRASDASKNSALWILGAVTALLVLVVGLTVLVHIEIQPTELVLGGAFVGVVAVSLWMLNTSFEASKFSGTEQAAAAANAISNERSILVGEGASF
ncbi:MAG: CAP domain-containing protein [Patescibacteria group bacterium]